MSHIAADSYSCMCQQLIAVHLTSARKKLAPDVLIASACSPNTAGRAAIVAREYEPSNGSPSLSALAKKRAFRSRSDTNLVKSIYLHSFTFVFSGAWNTSCCSYTRTPSQLDYVHASDVGDLRQGPEGADPNVSGFN